MGDFGWDLVQRSLECDMKSANDVLVSFVHWKLLSHGLRCVGLGDHFQVGSDDTPSELLPRDWASQDATEYTFKYRHAERTAEKYLLKALAVDTSLVMSFIRMGDEKCQTWTLQASEVVDLEEHNVRDKDELSKQADEGLLNAIFPQEEPEAQKKQEESRVPGHDPLRVGSPRYPGRNLREPHPLFQDPLGSSDLDPLGRMGSGMMFHPPGMGPGRPRFDPAHPLMPDPFGPRGGGAFGPGGGGGGRRNFGDEMQPPGFNNENMFF